MKKAANRPRDAALQKNFAPPASFGFEATAAL